MTHFNGSAAGDSPDFSGDYPHLVEAAGQPVHLFRDGLDYAFILNAAIGVQDAERVMTQLPCVILVPAQRRKATSAGL